MDQPEFESSPTFRTPPTRFRSGLAHGAPVEPTVSASVALALPDGTTRWQLPSFATADVVVDDEMMADAPVAGEWLHGAEVLADIDQGDGADVLTDVRASGDVAQAGAAGPLAETELATDTPLNMTSLTDAELAELQANAFSEGREAGRIEGEHAIRAEYADAEQARRAAEEQGRERLQAQLAHGLEVALGRLDAELAATLGELVARIASSVVREESRRHHDIVGALVAECIDALRGETEAAVLEMHPDDVGLLAADAPPLPVDGSSVAVSGLALPVRAALDTARGDIRITHPGGVVRVSLQERIDAALTDVGLPLTSTPATS